MENTATITNTNNVILIGMPGVGKSTVGIVLAKVLGYDFIDSDLLIQKAEGRLLWQIMRDVGNEEFNRIEERVNSGICADRSVIATGGSVIYGPRAMEHLRSIGTVVYLEADCATLAGRLGDLTRRGVVFRPGQGLADLYQERTPLYRKYAHITIQAGDQTVPETVAAIEAALRLPNPDSEA